MVIPDSVMEAARYIERKTDRAAFIAACCDYVCDGIEPTLKGMLMAMFAGQRYSLDKSRMKSKAGSAKSKQAAIKSESNANQTEIKSESNANQTEIKRKSKSTSFKKEKEKEKEKEEEKEELFKSPNGDLCRANARRKATAPERREIIDYLNAKTGKAFKASTQNTTSLINARFAEGFTVDDFKRVIDAKCADWIGVTATDGRDMGEYLRPSTLFRPSNFESYLNSETTASKPVKEPSFYITGSAEGDRKLREEMGGSPWS